MLKLDNI